MRRLLHATCNSGRRCSSQQGISECRDAWLVLTENNPQGVANGDLKSAQRLYYQFAKRHHPDRGGTEDKMKLGNSAFRVLRETSDQIRKRAAIELTQKTSEAVSPTSTQKSASRHASPFWEANFDEFEEAEYRAFLRTLEGTDQIRFHRTFRAPDGKIYYGPGKSEQLRRESFVSNQSHSHVSDPFARCVIGVAIVVTLSGYLIVMTVLGNGVVKKFS